MKQGIHLGPGNIVYLTLILKLKSLEKYIWQKLFLILLVILNFCT